MAEPVTLVEPVATADIAERLGVTSSAVSNYKRRDPNFPEPVLIIAKGTVEVFEWSEVRKWAVARRTGIDGRYGEQAVYD